MSDGAQVDVADGHAGVDRARAGGHRGDGALRTLRGRGHAHTMPGPTWLRSRRDGGDQAPPRGRWLAFLAVGCVVIFGGFLLLLRTIGSDPSPGLLSAQGTAHRLLTGRESIDTDVQRDGEYVFRVVYQTSDGNVGARWRPPTSAWRCACAATARPTRRASPTCTSSRHAATGGCS